MDPDAPVSPASFAAPPARGGAAGVITAIVVAILMLLAVLAWHLDHPEPMSAHRLDLALYQGIYEGTRDGLVPYRDFRLEYPPLAMVPFLLPALLPMQLDGTALGYSAAFGEAMIVLSVGVIVAASRVRRAMASPPGKTSTSLGLLLAAMLFVSPEVLFRFDIWPAFLTAVALWAAASRRAVVAGLFLAFGTLAKVYPIVLVPLFLLFFLADGDRRAAVRFVLGGLVGVMLVAVPTTLVASNWAKMFVGYHAGRGLQIESLPSSLYLLAAKLGVFRVDVVTDHGAYGVSAPGTEMIARLVPLLTVASLAAVYAFAFQRLRRDRHLGPAAAVETLALASLLSVLGFMTFNKVLSPQFFVWLVPMVGLVRFPIGLLLTAVCALTTLVFQWLYVDLFTLQSMPAVVALVARNGLMVIAFAIGLRLLAARPAASPTR